MIRFAEGWAGEGLVCVPEGGVTMVECTISTRVDGDVLKVFWSYCSEVGFIKVPRDNKSCIWVRGFLLTYIPVQFPECLVCVGLGGYINSRDYDGCKFPWQPEWSTQKRMKFQIRGAEGMLVIPLLVIIEMTPHLNKQSGSNQTGSKPS